MVALTQQEKQIVELFRQLEPERRRYVLLEMARADAEGWKRFQAEGQQRQDFVEKRLDGEKSIADPWVVFEYEASMLESILKLSQSEFGMLLQTYPIGNALVESALLHLRQLVDIVLSRSSHHDEILLRDLVGDYSHPTLEKLRLAYGSSSELASPCRILNKMFAHPTKERTDRYDYSELLNTLGPLVLEVVADVRQKREVTA